MRSSGACGGGLGSRWPAQHHPGGRRRAPGRSACPEGGVSSPVQCPVGPRVPNGPSGIPPGSPLQTRLPERSGSPSRAFQPATPYRSRFPRSLCHRRGANIEDVNFKQFNEELILCNVKTITNERENHSVRLKDKALLFCLQAFYIEISKNSNSGRTLPPTSHLRFK